MPMDLLTPDDIETLSRTAVIQLGLANVIGMPCAPEWHRPGMLELVGPPAFGYDVDFVELPR